MTQWHTIEARRIAPSAAIVVLLLAFVLAACRSDATIGAENQTTLATVTIAVPAIPTTTPNSSAARTVDLKPASTPPAGDSVAERAATVIRPETAPAFPILFPTPATTPVPAPAIPEVAVTEALPAPSPATLPRSSSPPVKAVVGTPKAATQTNNGGNVTVEITWDTASSSAESLVFSVVMDTHSVDLDGVDLSKTSVLRNDAGQQVNPLQWQAPAGGHHRSGTLVFPGATASLAAVSSETKFFEIVVNDVAGVKERIFRWDLLR